MLKVFVYGTLKPGESNYQRYCAGKIIPIQVGMTDVTPVRAYTFGNLFTLQMGYPAMTTGKSKVYGYLLAFSDCEIMKDLDDLEGYDPSLNAASNLYNRYQVEIFNLQNQPIGNAWTYFMSQEKVKEFKGVYIKDGWWS
ncbi:MAG: gamma-glutamylcyclotransferase [Cyanobacteria bacterium P01_A01_bin.84]